MSHNLQIRTCPLCRTTEATDFFRDDRDFLRCSTCRLVFVPPDQLPSAAAEKAQYDQHRNSPQDQQYRNFLNRLFEPLSQRLPAHSRGLDFGSGPGPTLSVMFEEAGHTMQLYDPFYAPDRRVLDSEYDFITASEVVEHLHHPRDEFDHLWCCLRPGGLLGVMTKRVIDAPAFARWHYKDDPTHVSFFSDATFDWLASLWQADLTIVASDVVLIQKAG